MVGPKSAAREGKPLRLMRQGKIGIGERGDARNYRQPLRLRKIFNERVNLVTSIPSVATEAPLSFVE